jgi:hypothetical protein
MGFSPFQSAKSKHPLMVRHGSASVIMQTDYAGQKSGVAPA